MAPRSHRASAPGSLMILGEHAVLTHNKAIVAAIDKKITVSISTRDDNKIKIDAKDFGNLELELGNIDIQAPFEHVISTIKLFEHKICGLDVTINSEFRHDVGFGSSAAVTVAMVDVLLQLCEEDIFKEKLFKLSKDSLLLAKKRGSGADIAASVYGGLIHYCSEPFEVKKLPALPSIVAIYAGYKTPTSVVLAKMAEKQAADPVNYSRIMSLIDICVVAGENAIKAKDWIKLGNIMNEQHKLLVELGVSDNVLDKIHSELCEHESIIGAKISGAGLGDCVIGLGNLPEETFKNQMSVSCD